MGLAFLVPAFLAGLAAIAIPVIIHLTRRQRSQVVEFPSLMFLERIPYRSMRRRKIRHWLLLTVRAAAIGLLVAAFARPLLTDVDLEAGTVMGPREVVILLDRSYSMAEGGRWERALEAARNVVSGLQPVDRTSLILFDAGAEAVTRSTSESGRVSRALDDAAIGSLGTRYGPGLKLAESVLAESDLPNRTVVLISDFQRAGWSGDEDVSFPAGTVITPVPVTGTGPDAPPAANLTVAGVEVRRELFSGRERVTVGARVTRVGGQDDVEVPVTLRVDGRDLESRPVSLGPDGAATVGFEPFTLAERFTWGSVSVEDGTLPPDDSRHFVLSPGEASSVLLVRNRGAEERSTLYLERALAIARGTPFRVDVRDDAALDAELAGRSVVVLADAALPSGRVDALTAYVEAGGGLLLVLGESSRIPAEAADLLPARVGAPVDRAPAGRVGYLDFSHPVFEAFAGADGGDFSRARYYRYRELEPAEDARVLARFDDGAPAVVERRIGQGRVIVWASAADNFWNDLVLQPLFLPLLHETVEYLRGDAPVPDAYLAGSVLDLSDPMTLGLRPSDELPTGARRDADRVALTPRGGSVSIPADSPEPWLDLRESGFYRVRAPGSDEARPVTVAVNVDIAESDLRAMDPEELVLAVSANQSMEGGEGDGGRDGAVVRAEDLERRQGFWRFLLVGAFLLLVVETAMSNRLSRGRATGGLNAQV